MGYTASVDQAVAAAIAGIPDQALQVNVNDIIIPSDMTNILAAFAVGPSLTRVQLVSPSLRAVWNQEVFGIDLNAATTDALLLEYYGQNAIPLAPGEPLNAFFAEGAAGASRGTVLVWLCDTPPGPILADIRTIRVTGAFTAVANTWTNGNLVFNDTLPAGTYALVGAQIISANMQAFRFVFKGGFYRPGAIAGAALSTRQNQLFRHGNMGQWGQFQNLTPPSIDVLCNGADTSFQGVLDLVQVG